ncbi:hypothetical protein dqs_2025 [Azoarcus olearius]|nr:hypothetical protein dqs_2025 [Azoarcus olearius]
MKVRLVRLNIDGVRRSRDECRSDPGVFGTLIIDGWVVGNAEHQPLKTAKLWHWYPRGGGRSRRPQRRTLVQSPPESAPPVSAVIRALMRDPLLNVDCSNLRLGPLADRLTEVPLPCTRRSGGESARPRCAGSDRRTSGIGGRRRSRATARTTTISP